VNLVLLGPPGAGKGTQAARISEAFGLVHLSSGDILRAERKARTQLGLKAQGYMDRGALVPDDLILTMMMDQIGRIEKGRGFLLDGFPRTLAQAQELDMRLEKKGVKIDKVVNIAVDDVEVTRRMTGRWSCPQDGSVFHEIFSPPSQKGLCNTCGTALVRRKDDEPDVVRQRLMTYYDQTKPLEVYYDRRGFLRSVDGGRAVDEVTAAIKRVCQAP
jgi:adenylate kinase